MIKIKIILVLAVLLTMFAVNAKAINPFAEYCTEGNQQDTITIPTCAGDLEVVICWNCPSTPGDSIFRMNILSVSGITLPLSSSCDWREEVANYLVNWPFISALCPAWSNVPPCFPPPTPYYGVELGWALCGYLRKVDEFHYDWEPCLPVECLCVGHWSYCYENGRIMQTWVNQTYESLPPYSGSCPPSGDCSYYNSLTVPLPLLINGTSPCYNGCD